MDPFARFVPFCRALKITSKEYGKVPLLLNGPQKEFVRRLRKGYAQGKRTFVVLKGRQEGISTVCNALDLFWPAQFPSIQGGIIVDSDEARKFFRSVITQYHEELDVTWKIQVKRHNDDFLLLANGSRLDYMTAGRRKSSGSSNLGQSKAINFAHATEVSSYGDQEGLDRAIGAVFAEHFPHRLYIFESTAKGFNGFHEMWTQAKRSITQEAIFLPWWLKEDYVARGQVLEVYGGLDLDSEERKWVEDVERRYGYKMREEQLAWWRFKLNETYKGNLVLAYQEFAPTEDLAFQMTGSAFFSAERLTLAMKHIKSETQAPDGYRYTFGIDPMDVRVHPCDPQIAELKIWRHPVPGGVYVSGNDPAYGSSELADQFCIQVFRCFGDKLEQVAEYCTPGGNTDTYAWVSLHLAGYYGGARINLEIDGPGTAVWSAMKAVVYRRSEFSKVVTGGSQNFSDVLGTIKWYLWSRPDSMSRQFAYHHKTSPGPTGTKVRMMNMLQSSFELERLILHSPDLLREMRSIANKGGSIEAEGRAKDDRVIAAGLAHLAWADWVMMELRERKMWWQPALAEQQSLTAQGQRAKAGEISIEKFLPENLKLALRR